MTREALERLVADIAAGPEIAGEKVDRAADGEAISWSREGMTFAVLGTAGIELRLDRRVAGAATHTPDAGPSPRGPEWVRFNPRQLDGHAVDRLEAWFALAARRATETKGRR